MSGFQDPNGWLMHMSTGPVTLTGPFNSTDVFPATADAPELFRSTSYNDNNDQDPTRPHKRKRVLSEDHDKDHQSQSRDRGMALQLQRGVNDRQHGVALEGLTSTSSMPSGRPHIICDPQTSSQSSILCYNSGEPQALLTTTTSLLSYDASDDPQARLLGSSHQEGSPSCHTTSSLMFNHDTSGDPQVCLSGSTGGGLQARLPGSTQQATACSCTTSTVGSSSAIRALPGEPQARLLDLETALRLILSELSTSGILGSIFLPTIPTLTTPPPNVLSVGVNTNENSDANTYGNADCE